MKLPEAGICQKKKGKVKDTRWRRRRTDDMPNVSQKTLTQLAGRNVLFAMVVTEPQRLPGKHQVAFWPHNKQCLYNAIVRWIARCWAKNVCIA